MLHKPELHERSWLWLVVMHMANDMASYGMLRLVRWSLLLFQRLLHANYNDLQTHHHVAEMQCL